MAVRLDGSCRCGAVHFAVDSHTPYPYQRCYCSICRKSAGGGGYAINIMGVADTLEVEGMRAIRKWHAPIGRRIGAAERSFCRHCGTPLIYERPPKKMINIPRALFESRTGRQPIYHIGIDEAQDWAYGGERLVPLKGYPGVVWTRPVRKKRAAAAA